MTFKKDEKKSLGRAGVGKGGFPPRPKRRLPGTALGLSRVPVSLTRIRKVKKATRQMR